MKAITSIIGTVATAGTHTIVAAPATGRIKVFAYNISTSVTTVNTVTFKNGANGTDLYKVIAQATSTTSFNHGQSVAPVNSDCYLFATDAAVLLDLNLSAATSVNYSISYWTDDLT